MKNCNLLATINYKRERKTPQNFARNLALQGFKCQHSSLYSLENGGGRNRIGRRENGPKKVGRREKQGEKVGRREKKKRNRLGRREKLAQKVGRREIYPPVPPPKNGTFNCLHILRDPGAYAYDASFLCPIYFFSPQLTAPGSPRMLSSAYLREIHPGFSLKV